MTTGLAGAGRADRHRREHPRVLGYGIAAARTTRGSWTTTSPPDRARRSTRGRGRWCRSPSGFAARGRDVAARYLALFGGRRDRARPRPARAGDRALPDPAATASSDDRRRRRSRSAPVVAPRLIADNRSTGVGGGGIVMGRRRSGRDADRGGQPARRRGPAARRRGADRGRDRAERRRATSPSRATRSTGSDATLVGEPAAPGSRSPPATRCASPGTPSPASGPPDEFFGISAGIVVLDAFQRADVLDNGVRRAEGDPTADPHSPWYGILIGGAGKGAKAAGAAFTVVYAGDNAYRFHPAARTGRQAPAGPRDSLAVRGNVVEAYGTGARGADRDRSPRACSTTTAASSPARENLPTARLHGRARRSRANNYLTGPPAVRSTSSWSCRPAPRYRASGNIASGADRSRRRGPGAALAAAEHLLEGGQKMQFAVTVENETLDDLVTRVYAFDGTPSASRLRAARKALTETNPYLRRARPGPPRNGVHRPRGPGRAAGATQDAGSMTGDHRRAASRRGGPASAQLGADLGGELAAAGRRST